MGILGRTFLENFDLRVSVVAKATVQDNALDTLKTGHDGRYCGPPFDRHLPEQKSG